MNFQNTRHHGRTLLLCAASSIAVSLGAPDAFAKEGDASENKIEFVAPSASLDDTLIKISRTFGADVVGADNLIAGKKSAPVARAASIEQALDASLAGTGLSYARSKTGAYVLVAQSNATAAPLMIDGSADENGTPTVSDTIVVTGSRIERTAVNAPSPIDIVTAEDIAKLGLNDTTEALRFTPALQQSTSLTSPAEFFDENASEAGVATLNLRGLGANRTLVLLNGRRHVGGVANQSTVDVSSFPTALIDRVEVLTGGGSSIYGADAVSGVVNYILKDDFEGVDYRGNISLPTRGDGEAYFAALTMGGNFADGRGNAVVSVEYNKQTQVRNRDRGGSRTASSVQFNTPLLSEGLGVSPDFKRVLVPDWRFNFFGALPSVTFTESAFGLGALALDGITEIGGVPISQVIDSNTGEIRPQDFGIIGTNLFSSGGDGTLFTFNNPEAATVPDFERYSINTFAHYDFSDKITGFVEAKYNRLDSSAGRNFNLRAIDVPISLDNPFLPELFRDQFNSLDAMGEDPNLLASRDFRDPFSSGPGETIRETFRIIGGFEGTISKALSYNVSVNYGRTDTDIINTNEVIPDRFYAAVDVVEDPVTGNPVCRSDIVT
ncbi:MAG: TonB-dependent receptor plug domain-containing protein [Pseudomonadota bacterium]